MVVSKPFFKQEILTIVVLICMSMFCCECLAQESAKNEETFYPHHQLGLIISHAQVFEGRDENGKKKTLSMPAWGIDYTYLFHPKWGIGLHTDIIVEKFEAEGDGKAIERNHPVAPALMGIFKPNHHWSLLLGIGEEFAEKENFTLTRAGVEYGAELPKEWEVFGALSYDFKWNVYDTWSVGIGIAKVFGKRKQERK